MRSGQRQKLKNRDRDRKRMEEFITRIKAEPAREEVDVAITPPESHEAQPVAVETVITQAMNVAQLWVAKDASERRRGRRDFSVPGLHAAGLINDVVGCVQTVGGMADLMSETLQKIAEATEDVPAPMLIRFATEAIDRVRNGAFRQA